MIDNISKYSPCGCFVWKDRSKIIYANPEEAICTPIEWAQLVCKQLEDTTCNNKNNDDVGNCTSRNEEITTIHEEHHQEEKEEEEQEGVLRRSGRDLSMNIVHDSGFPVNYTLGDQIFPPKEELCLDCWFYRPFI